jgi:hypothetical protein
VARGLALPDRFPRPQPLSLIFDRDWNEAAKMTTEITLITKCDSDSGMSKRIFLDNDGVLRSDGSQCLMTQGNASRVPAPGAGDLAKIIANCRSNQAICLGALNAELPNSVPITVPRKLKEGTGAITRSREFIDYRPGAPAWCLIDFDTKGMPARVAARIQAEGGMWNALTAVAPGIRRAAHVTRGSTSSGLLRSDTGEPVSGSNGMHHYVLLRDGGDVERFLHDLHDCCWLDGLGWHVIGGAGQLLDRSLVDRMVGYGERLCFEGAPVVIPPLMQDASKRVPEVAEGEAIDSLVTVPPPTEYERHRIKEAKEASAQALHTAAAEIRTQHDRILAEGISQKSGMPITSATRLVTARHRGVLLPHIELEFDHLGMVAVATVLADPDRFLGETLADPLEGVSYGRAKALVMKAADGGLFIHSFAHGRGLYRLQHDLQSARAAIAQTPPNAVVDHALAVLSATNLEPDELEEFVATVARAANISTRALMARVNNDRKHREAEVRKAAMASRVDGRVIRPRPEPDGELRPTVDFLDELLASDQGEEPPMRDASGNLVEVRVREPWNLHQLTADGTNASAEKGEKLKAPAEPALIQLTPTGIELLTEKYVRFAVHKKNASYFGALPRPYVEALREYSPSKILVARTINTSPLVTKSGKIIDGFGLDRETGLVHRIDPLLRACLPSCPLRDRDVHAALNFLFNEFLVDVALDNSGKCVAIMLALTIIERAFLPERPAFFVTAGQRGGGKTTLLNMIAAAVLGRKAAAAAWSKNPEERKKALFSYLRQGVAFLTWDNIPRGLTVSCPHIEAALTAAEISDRVLGVSRVEAVPATTVQAFTGNMIAPRGDLASRSLMMMLNVNRPDPENRAFTHLDPFAWIESNRPVILRALYTVLLGGALNRPSQQAAKTRFKTWWSLIGWPMEFAADLAGITMDCAELFRGGETADEDALAVSTALTVCREIWDNRNFTAGAVAKELGRVASFENFNDDDAESARANTLADALGELAGKRLEKPTAHSIGKLFQKRLVDRPAWIGDDQTIAILRKSPGHQENKYRVELLAPGQAGRTERLEADLADKNKNNPNNPHNPPGRSANDGSQGNQGKVGNGLGDLPYGKDFSLANGGWRRRI